MVSSIYPTKPSRFQYSIYGPNLTQARRTKKRNHKAAQKANAKLDLRRRTVKGFTLHDPMYDLDVDMSVDGKGFGNPLTDTLPGQEYLIRTKVNQHQAEPLLQGFTIAWLKPPKWAWVDGLPQRTQTESISNALVLVRVCRPPGHNTVTIGDPKSNAYLRFKTTAGFPVGSVVKIGSFDSFVRRKISKKVGDHVYFTRALDESVGKGTLIRSNDNVGGNFRSVVTKRFEEGR